MSNNPYSYSRYNYDANSRNQNTYSRQLDSSGSRPFKDVNAPFKKIEKQS